MSVLARVDRPILLALIAHIPVDGIAKFLAYEDAVLPLLADHGGVLQRRLRTADGGVELHLVWFPSEAAYQGFRQDPRRDASAPLLAASGVAAELLWVEDVAADADGD